mmetsp:Transcript_11549/g.17747  ORF Transcript_11549/g.17747 Transcript_11549/m.17747 type:complete len:197 (-) Transcript_11549:810-1400(-)
MHHRTKINSDSENMAAYYDSPRQDSLLEHWPKPMALKSSLADSSTHNRSKKSRVRFSDSSWLHTYQRSPISLLRSLSYTKEDNDKFGKLAQVEGMRIKDLIADAPQDSASQSIKHLLRRGSLSTDELRGIDHFIFAKPTRVRKMRKDHAAAVLRKQQELRQDRQTTNDLLSSLSKFAQSSSLKSMQRARIRAAVAA